MTATSVETGLDISLVEALDFDHEPACEAQNNWEKGDDSECGASADYLCEFVGCKCCGPFFLCQDCLIRWKNDNAMDIAVHGYVICGECGYESPEFDLHVIKKI